MSTNHSAMSNDAVTDRRLRPRFTIFYIIVRYGVTGLRLAASAANDGLASHLAAPSGTQRTSASICGMHAFHSARRCQLCSELDSAETQNARPEKLRSGWGVGEGSSWPPSRQLWGLGEHCKLPGVASSGWLAGCYSVTPEPQHYGALCANMMSSIKPEIPNLSQHRQRWSEPRTSHK